MEFKWRSSYSVHNDVLDDQHKKIFEVINQMENAMFHQRVLNFEEYIKQLLEYASEHFETEEVMMRDSKYPKDKYEQHVEEHKKEKSFFIDIYNQYINSPSVLISDTLLNELKNWVIDHVLGSDHDYIEYIKED